jgi:peptidoglycan hydrolase CwlO-like protein
VVIPFRPSLRASGAVLAAALLLAAPATADLGGQIQSSKGKDRSLQSQIGSDSSQIAEFRGRIGDIQARLDALQQSLHVEQAELASLQGRLRDTRSRLAKLRLAYVRDRAALAQQLIAQYEVDKPDLVSVVLASRSWGDLLETADNLHAVADRNASVATRVKNERTAVTKQARELSQLTAQQSRVTAASLTQRDEVDSLKMTLIAREVGVQRARATKQSQLATLRADRKKLENKLASLQARSAGLDGAGPGLPAGGAPTFGSHGGAYGFFQAPGTNYSVGNEPTLAARLDVLGKALHLHLIGISGYRSPQHSVEVGGFADDPHTEGLASDTPGVEGVPESTLRHYGLTRPFAGAAEADHIQLA